MFIRRQVAIVPRAELKRRRARFRHLARHPGVCLGLSYTVVPRLPRSVARPRAPRRLSIARLRRDEEAGARPAHTARTRAPHPHSSGVTLLPHTALRTAAASQGGPGRCSRDRPAAGPFMDRCSYQTRRQRTKQSPRIQQSHCTSRCSTRDLQRNPLPPFRAYVTRDALCARPARVSHHAMASHPFAPACAAPPRPCEALAPRCRTAPDRTPITRCPNSIVEYSRIG